MKKRLIIYIPSIAVLVLLLALLLLSNYQTPAWKTMLDQYLFFLRSAGEPSYQMVAAVQASQPSHFTPNMTTGSFSNSVTYLPTESFDGDYFSGLEPVPYPPDQVWCVLLKDDGQQELVFVALHNSDYSTNWIVHIPSDPWGSPALQSTMESLGCIVNSQE
jgi:hypothetical protein